MYAAYTELKKAEKVKLYLAKHNLFNQDFLPVRELGHIYFPLRKRAKVPHAEITKPKFKFPQKPLKLTVDVDIQFLIREELIKFQSIFQNKIAILFWKL